MLHIKDFLHSLAKTSRFGFQLWTIEKGPVFSSEPLPANGSSCKEFTDFSAQIIRRQSFLHRRYQEHDAVFGLAFKNGMDVAGALIVYIPEFYKQSQPKDSASAKLPNIKEMETFLAHLARLIEYQLSSQIETEKMAEELSHTFEDLVLFSKIGLQTQPLLFSSKMLYDLIENLLETMRAELAFAWLPEQSDYSAVIPDEKFSTKTCDPNAFVKALIDRIPPDIFSSKEECFIMQDSRSVQGYRKLHPDPYRFLAVMIETNDNLYGWMGVVSYNLKEIFRQSELKLLKSLASSTAVALENSRLFSESVQMAKKERYVRNIFQKYVPEAVANEILERGDRDLITLGEKRLVTLLNVDIRGYSRISKNLKSEDVVLLINYFFMTMGSAILKHNGILDKYLGDGILAVFGAPVASSNPALDATLAALEMRTQVEKVNAFARERYGETLAMGISIHTGEVIVGNIGFEKKMEYTVIGDVVNDTFRLQEFTRATPNSILIGKTTYQKIKPFMLTKPLGVKTLGAGEGQMEVYEVLDRKKGPA